MPFCGYVVPPRQIYRNSTKTKMDLFTAMNNAFCFDVTSDFLKKFWSFGLLFAQIGFVLKIKMRKFYSRDVFKIL